MRILLLVFVTVALWGQNTGMVITLRHIKSEYAFQIANAFSNGKVIFQMTPGSPNVVMSGPPESLAIVENAIKKADVPEPPPQNVELLVYVLAAADGAGGSPLPEDLAGVAKQMKGVLGIPTLRLIESIQIRARVGKGGEATGILGKSADRPNLYQLRFNEVTVQDTATGRSLRLSGLKFGGKISTGTSYVDTGFSTDIDLKEGQKVVIGKSSLDTSGTPYFVVVTGKVVD